VHRIGNHKATSPDHTANVGERKLTFPARDLPSASPKAVIFDIGRVIVRLNRKRGFGISSSNGFEATSGLSTEQIWIAVQADPRWCDWQEGRMTPQEWHGHITGQLRIAVAFEEFCSAWNSTLDPEPILPDDLFARLATRCSLALLSNTDPIHVAYLERHFSFMHHFPVRIYSNKVGASKPSPAIYEAALSALGVAPAESLYIDDISEYAEAARQLGIDAIHFENSQQLGRELSRRGLTP
jgi:glucose-1-phosphatase